MDKTPESRLSSSSKARLSHDHDGALPREGVGGVHLFASFSPGSLLMYAFGAVLPWRIVRP